ncbi:MAG: hypothetical protein JXK04_00655 [Campylobacterales bacterium]|nr:hypothetical protein [Campylobacterales bacterium]
MREETLLSPGSVSERSGYLEWDTQPSQFKTYPPFCYRLSLADFPSLEWLERVRCITDVRNIGGRPYRRLNVPSAGNLHPIEIYVQLRNMTGILSGIYHLDVPNRELVMVSEIASEGCELYVGLEHRFNGVIVMISLVPFRSGWKYGRRSWRYLYLDLGHQIGALAASVRHFGLELTKMSPVEGLNRAMGMGPDETVAAVYGVGEVSHRGVKGLSLPLIQVQPTDYLLSDEVLLGAIRSAAVYTEIPAGGAWPFFERVNRLRRSAREFHPDGLGDEALRFLMATPSPPSLEIVMVVLHAHAIRPGVYREGICTQEGDFDSDIVHLLLEQRFTARANMVVLIGSERFDAHAHVDAGVYAQGIGYAAWELDAVCSGIGAFYDDEARRWLRQPMLYAVAIGGKR